MTSERIKKLLQACAAFEKKADSFNLSKVIKTYKPLLQYEYAAGIRSINRLVTTNKNAANARSLEVLDSAFGKIGIIADRLNPEDPRGTDIAIKDMTAAASSAAFYTHPYNAGTGYDPITHMGGNDSPAAHLSKIMEILKKFEVYVKYNEVIAPKPQE